MKLAKERETRILGISSVGLPIYGISGAEPEVVDETKDKQTGSGAGAGGTGGADEDSEGSGELIVDTEEADKTYTKAEYEQILNRLRAADQAKGKAEKRLNELDEAQLSELEKAKKDLADAHARIADLQTKEMQGRIANAILQFPGFTWHDPEVVLQVVDKDMIEFDEETGRAKGVKAALEKLAKDKPYLLKGKTSGTGGSGGGANNGAGTKVGSSGHSPNGEGRPDDKNATRKALAKKYKL